MIWVSIDYIHVMGIPGSCQLPMVLGEAVLAGKFGNRESLEFVVKRSSRVAESLRDREIIRRSF